jgi:NADH-quinone oxidoreductase subunit G
MPKLKINNTEIDVAPGTSILQAAEQIGVEIPRFCYHDKLSVPANCRMCLVEVKGAPKPVASCAMACGDNMEVFTDSAMTQKARKGVMEMLLINHPLDCPICDQGGECDLQDQAVSYGFDRSRYYESKRAVRDKDIGPLVKTVMNRCIQCTRCVRFCDEIAGTAELGLLNRGENVEIGPFLDKYVTTELSGNLVDVCPVGALTNKPYAFAARPWELKKTESIDVMDAVGSNIRIDTRGNEVMRVLPRLNEDINEEWIGDRTRYAVDGLKFERLDRPYMRDASTKKLRPASWDEALKVAGQRLRGTPADKMAALAGDLVAIDEMVAIKDLWTQMGSTQLDCRVDGAMIDGGARGGYLFNTTIAGLEQADAVLLVGANPRIEATMVNARIRKTWLQSGKKLPVAAIGPAVDLTYPVVNIGEGSEALEALIKGDQAFAKTWAAAKKPVVIVGMGILARGDGHSIIKRLYDWARETGVVHEDWNGWNILHTAAARVGGLDIGFTGLIDLPAQNTVYLLGVDDRGVLDQIRPDAFVIYQGHHGNAGAARADVVLPGAAYTEKSTLYVNLEGRPQSTRLAAHPPGEAREDWKIIRALSDAAGYTLPYDTHAALRARIVGEWPHLAAIGSVPQGTAMPKTMGKAGSIARTPFQHMITNYYQTNVITAVSPTMQECARAFLGYDVDAAKKLANG